MRTIKIPLVAAAIVLLFVTTSCIDDMFISGNGDLRTETRIAPVFNEVSSSGDFEVTIMPSNSYSIEVSAESNLLPYIETDVVGNKLKIHTRGIHSLRNHLPIQITIETPVLDGLSLSGSGTIQTGSFESSSFSANISGSGKIDTQISADQVKAVVSGSGILFLRGDAASVSYTISGSGKIKSYELVQKNCSVTISGSGDAFVNVLQTLSANISGSGRVYFVGNPAVHTSISGSGSVVDKN